MSVARDGNGQMHVMGCYHVEDDEVGLNAREGYGHQP